MPTWFLTATERWLGELRSDNTRAAYRRDLAVFLDWLTAMGHDAAAANASTLSDFRDFCIARGAGAATVNRRLSTVSSFYRFASATSGPGAGIGPLPAARVERTPVGDASPTAPLPPRPAAKVFRAALDLGPRPAALVGLLLHDGLKLQEAIAIDVAAVRTRTDPVTLDLARRGGPVRIALDPRSAPPVRVCARGRSEGPLLMSRSSAVGSDDAALTRFGARLPDQAGGRGGGPQ